MKSLTYNGKTYTLTRDVWHTEHADVHHRPTARPPMSAHGARLKAAPAPRKEATDGDD